MIAGLRPYPEYRESGFRWLGAIPSSWSLVPGRDAFEEVIDRDHPDEPLLSVTIKHGVIRQEELLADSSNKDSSNVDKSSYKLVLSGDVAYNKMRAWQGAVGVSRYRGIVSPAYIVLRSARRIDPAYAHYLLRIPAFASEAERWSYGITSDQWSLRPKDFRQIYFNAPPAEDQAAIVRYLDHVDSRIQRFIAAKGRLIELLEEEKQAIINRAVTRGMDPRTELRASRVPWIGKIPRHWQIRKLQELTDPSRPIMYGIVLPGPDVEDGVYIVKGGNCEPGRLRPELLARTTFEIAAKHVRSRLDADDIVIAIRGGVGAAEVVPPELSGANLTQDAARISPRPEIVTHWLLTTLRSHVVQQHIQARIRGATVTGINIRDLRRVPVPVPPRHEQERISRHVGGHQQHADRAINQASRHIALLLEYRTRLISDVVTGKIDVRETAAKLPDDPGAEDAALDDAIEEAVAA